LGKNDFIIILFGEKHTGIPNGRASPKSANLSCMFRLFIRRFCKRAHFMANSSFLTFENKPVASSPCAGHYASGNMKDRKAVGSSSSAQPSFL
jgi:hypothetical protein